MASAFLCEEAPRALECKTCKASFSFSKVGPGRLPRFCSDPCRSAAIYAKPEAGRRHYQNKTPVAFVCTICGGRGETKQDRPGKYCSRDCQIIGTSLALKRDKPKSQCVRCGELFTPARPSAKQKASGHIQKFCSKRCYIETITIYPSRKESKKAYYGRRKARDGVNCKTCGKLKLSPLVDGNCKGCSSKERAHQLRVGKERAKKEPRECAGCSVEFVPLLGMEKYHSRECAREANRRINHARYRKAQKIGKYGLDPFRVFERDGWRCHLCGVKTLKSKRGTDHPKAPELEHIIPISKGGAHSYQNTACSCRQCNRAKRDKVMGQLRLFG